MDTSCSICADVFREPKGLPCLHTFCQECLQKYINKNADKKSFNCPICRRKTLPFDSQLPKSQWAKCFPTNNYVMKPRTTWKLCNTHKTEPMTINCKTCHVMICNQCCLSTHEKCVKIITEANAEKIRKYFLKGDDNLKAKLEPMKKRLSKLEADKSTTEKEINQTCQELRTYIRQQEKHWLEKIGTYSEKMDSLENEKRDIVDVIEKLQENIDELDNFIGEKDAKSEPQNIVTFDYQPKHILMDMIKDLLISTYDNIDYQMNPNFLKIKDEIMKMDMLEKHTSLEQ